MHEVFEHVRNLIAAETNNRVQLIRDYDPSLPEFLYDKDQLIQAVLNIMRNALQAATDPAECVITLRSRAQRHMTVGAKQHRLGCRIDIIDNGHGIAADLRDSLFIPMVSGRPEGSGLGLSISQAIVNRHNGLIESHSEPGCTEFNLYLPLDMNHATT